MSIHADPTIEDLYRVEGRAELVAGEIVVMNPTGDLPGAAAGEIYFHLRLYLNENDLPGRAYTDNVGFVVDLLNRKSFSPDVAYFVGERAGMKFISGAPLFAVEVRSENDYGEAAEKRMREKRADYFAAGTKVIWDVDLLNDDVIKCYTSETDVVVFKRSEKAKVPVGLADWEFPVDALFG